MKNKNLTAVDWLVEQFNLQAYIPHIQQAKQMEKEQIKNAFDDSELHNTGNENCSEIYYNYIYNKM